MGLEPSKFLVERAQHLYGQENRSFLLGNAYAMPFADNRFDAAFSIAVWHILEDLKKAAGELSRVLKPRGHFLIITADPQAYFAWTNRYSNSRSTGIRFEGIHLLPDGSESVDVLFLHGSDEIEDALRSSHLEINETEIFRNFILLHGQKI
jgi:ubiquinone/menaquinone biosynthesis C-methylase UbiE